jgi:hypothetical protein
MIFPNCILLNAATPLPVVHGPLPVAADSYPIGAADHTRVPTDLKKIGYLREEFLAEGKANIYEWPGQGAAVVRTANTPYTTRVLVRRPASKSKFRGNVIVEINHRLNVFGYCHLGDVGGEKYAASGNTGMLDLVQGLQWVHDNIEAFGRGLGKVIIFGESGGGVSFGVHSGKIDGIALCRMFNHSIWGHEAMPKHLSSDHNQLFLFERWRANLRGSRSGQLHRRDEIPGGSMSSRRWRPSFRLRFRRHSTCRRIG